MKRQVFLLFFRGIIKAEKLIGDALTGISDAQFGSISAQFPQRFRFLGQRCYFCHQLFAGEVFFFNDNSRMVPCQYHCIVILMVFRHIGRGNKHRGSPHRLQLCQRHSTGTGNYKVRSGKTIRHIVDVFPDIDNRVVLKGASPLPQKLGQQLYAVGAGRMDMVDLSTGDMPCHQLGNCHIDGLRAEAAAKG